jgi:hypothetical protein
MLGYTGTYSHFHFGLLPIVFKVPIVIVDVLFIDAAGEGERYFPGLMLLDRLMFFPEPPI